MDKEEEKSKAIEVPSNMEVIEELRKTQASLAAQEHRPWKVIENFAQSFDLDSDDPRRNASIIALLWSALYSPVTIAMGGGLVAVITVGVLIWQTSEIKIQNHLIASQNLTLRKSELTLRLYEEAKTETENHQRKNPKFSARSRQEAFLTLVELYQADEKILNFDRAHLSNMVINDREFSKFSFRGADFEGSTLARNRFNETIFYQTSFERCDLAATEFLCLEIEGSSFCSADLEATRFKIYSIRSSNFANVDAFGAVFDNCGIAECDFKNANLESASFRGARITTSDFSDSHLGGSIFDDTILEGVSFENTEGIASASFQGATFDEATLFPKGFDPVTHGAKKK